MGVTINTEYELYESSIWGSLLDLLEKDWYIFVIAAGVALSIYYIVKAARNSPKADKAPKVDWAKWFSQDYVIILLFMLCFLIYLKFPKMFAPLTVLAVLALMVAICAEYGKKGEKPVNKMVLIAAFVVPILPLIWFIVGTSIPWLHVLVMIVYVLLVALLLAINPNEFLGKYNQDTQSVYLVALVGLFSMVCVFLNKDIIGEPWPAYTARLGFLLLCLLSVGFAIQYAIRFFMQAPSMSPNFVLMGFILAGFALLFVGVVVKNMPRPTYYSKSNLFLLTMAVWVCRLQDMLVGGKFLSGALVVEILLILYYVYSRQLYTKLEEAPGGAQLLNEPVKLNRAKALTVSGFNLNYALSFWVWLMPQPPNESPTSTMFENILDYSGKPRVLYNAASNTLRISMQRPPKDGDVEGVHILMADIPRIPLQRWHHLVLAYNNGIFDIFLNGTLYLSVPAVVSNTAGEIVLGAEKGNRGKLCNLVLYKGDPDPTKSFTSKSDAISAEKVVSLYNQFANKTPPIITRILSIGPNPTYANMRVL